MERTEARVVKYQRNKKNNTLESNILLNTFSATHSENTNIFEINKKEKLQLQTKIDLKYNEHISNKNNTIYDNSRNAYSTNSTSYSKNDLIKIYKKGERNHNPENTILPIVAVAVVKIDHNIYDKKEKRKKYRHRYEKYSGYDNTNSTNTIPTGSKRKRSRK